jgi:triphosphoribosyl-dephospho-CoA synthase
VPLRLARAATLALLDELATTPKPGLVDLEHAGAHRDLCFERMTASAHALEPTFASIARSAQNECPSLALREELGNLGRRGERAMLRATGGTNAHRGAIWALGLLVAARSSLAGNVDARTIAERAGALARLPDRFAGVRATHGESVRRTYRTAGAYGEASRDFPHVTDVALPLVRGGTPGADVLLALLTRVDDTCVLHRGGRRALALAKVGARFALAAGGTTSPLGLRRTRALDAALVAHNASPGGCADLLASAFFLQAVV